MPIFVGHCSATLNEALNATQMALLAQKGGALLCLGALHDRLHKKAEYADNILTLTPNPNPNPNP